MKDNVIVVDYSEILNMINKGYEPLKDLKEAIGRKIIKNGDKGIKIIIFEDVNRIDLYECKIFIYNAKPLITNKILSLIDSYEHNGGIKEQRKIKELREEVEQYICPLLVVGGKFYDCWEDYINSVESRKEIKDQKDICFENGHIFN